MKFRWDNRYLHWGVTAFFVIAASMLFYYGIFHMNTLIAGIKTFFSLMAPIVYGFALAYLLSPVVVFLEDSICNPFLKKKKVTLEKRGRRAMRWVCVLLSLFFLLAVIYTLIMMILPQLIRSIMNLIYSFPTYVSSVEGWLNSFIEKGWDLDKNMIDMLTTYSNQAQEYLTTNILPQMQEMLKNISAGVFDVLVFFKNFVIGAIISIYVLADKEVFVARSKMMMYAMFNPKHANAIIHSMRFTNKTFGGFISGKILDSAIIGVLCYIGITILDMPYAILISVVIGVTNVIPFFGPYLGAIPCFLLILLVDPMKSLYFALFILILQQFDGNILGPKILGDSTGLSSFMVIVAIMIGGGLFGVPGMIVGVPVFAVLYAAAQNLLEFSLKKKDLPYETDKYYNIDCLDAGTKQPLPMPKEEKQQRRQKAAEKNPDSFFLKIYNKLYLWLKALIIKILKWLHAAWIRVRGKIKTLYTEFKNRKKN